MKILFLIYLHFELVVGKVFFRKMLGSLLLDFIAVVIPFQVI